MEYAKICSKILDVKEEHLLNQLNQVSIPFDFNYLQNIFVSNDGYWFSDNNKLYSLSENNETIIPDTE